MQINVIVLCLINKLLHINIPIIQNSITNIRIFRNSSKAK